MRFYAFIGVFAYFKIAQLFFLQPDFIERKKYGKITFNGNIYSCKHHINLTEASRDVYRMAKKYTRC
jgi:hypothetical protein